MRLHGLVLLLTACRFGFAEHDLPCGSACTTADGAAGGGDGDGGGAPVTGLVADWSFDEGTGQVVHDATGVHDGVLGTTSAVESVDPLWETAPGRACSGSALTFDGTNDIATIAGPSAANLGTFSIAFSLDATGAGGGQLPRIITKEDGTTSDVIVHFRAIDSAVAINMLDTANTVYATYGGAVVLGQRANWVVIYDDTGDRRVHIYQNGAEVTYLRQDPMIGTLRVTTNSWEIGDQASTSRAFAGTLDAIRIYDRVLAPSEIRALSALCPP